MIRYTVKRLLLMIPILIGVIVIVFTINYFSTGSPAMAILGTSATPENIAAVEHEWGLDRPYFCHGCLLFLQAAGYGADR